MSLPRVLLFLSLWILAIAISFSRIILTDTRSILYKYIEVLNFNSDVDFCSNMTVWQAILPVSFISLWNVVLGVVPIILESAAVVWAIRH